MKRQRTEDPDIVKYENGSFYFRRGQKEISLKTKDFTMAVKRKRIIESAGDIFLRGSLKLQLNELKEDYLESRDADLTSGKIRISTLKETRELLEKYILPYFGKKVVTKIDSLMWEDFKKTKLPADLQNIRKVFSHLMKWCAKNGYKKDLLILDINPVERRQRRILKPKEMKVIFENSNGSLKIFVSLALFMGLRRTEIMTLEWSRINFKERSLFLPKNITKTKKSRFVPLAPLALDLLSERFNLQNMAGVRTPFVFPHANDPKKHAYKSGLRTAWMTCLKKAGLENEDITWHDLRATCEFYAHKRTDLSDTQLEKFFGASVEIQRKIYVSMDADDVRGVEDSLSLPQLESDVGKTGGSP